MNPTTMKWLLKRELWEHKGGFVWAPVLVAALIAIVLSITTSWLAMNGISRTSVADGVVKTDVFKPTSMALSDEQKAIAGGQIARSYLGTNMPLLAVLAFVSFFFCLNALYDERKDRSVLFWKSLPVPDSDTVLSKVITAVVIAPLITLVVAIVFAIGLVLVGAIASAFTGVNLFGAILSSTALYTAPFQVIAILPVYALWALPTVGWLLMVGAWAKTKPFLWAVGVPLIVGVLLSWFNRFLELGWSLKWYWQDVVGRGLLSGVPGSWYVFNPQEAIERVAARQLDAGTVLAQAWQQLTMPNIWIGAALGAAMIYLAIRIRRWKDEG
jgi:ABC-2 type transport system permease protein